MLVLALVATALNAHAEDHPTMSFKDSTPAEATRPARSESVFRLTPIGGLTVMNLKGSLDNSWDSSAGVAIGGFAELGSGPVSLQTGLVYNNYQMSKDVDFYTYRLRLEYLSVPVLARVNFFGDPNSTVYFKAGLMPSLLLSQNYSGGYWLFTKTTSSDVSAKSFDLPAIAALGGAIPVSRKHDKSVIVELSYVRSLTNNVTIDGRKAHTEGMTIMSGFSFSI